MPTENEIDRAKRVKSDSRVTEMIVRLANDGEECSVTTTVTGGDADAIEGPSVAVVEEDSEAPSVVL